MSNPKDPHDFADIPLHKCPLYDSKVSVFNATPAMFYAPSDVSGIGSMQCEIIQSCPLWRHGPQQLDCAFVPTNPENQGMGGMDVVHIHAFFLFRTLDGQDYPCAVV